MDIKIQRSEERGSANYGWLNTKYCFSFANYYNPKRIGFKSLLVLNEDHIAGKKGFGMHQHDNMEIVTIILDGSIEHKDSEGNHGLIKTGELQRISAGSGIMHSEYNTSDKNLHLLQIWVKTKNKNIKPSYEQKKIVLKKNKLTTIVSNKNKESIHINQYCEFSRGKLEKETKVTYKIKHSGAYVFIIDGNINIGSETLNSGDSAEITNTKQFKIETIKKSEILIIDLK